MKTLITLSLAVIFSTFAFAKAYAQPSKNTCDCLKDLSFVDEQIREMTSFKKQVKGQKTAQYESLYNSLRKQVSTQTPISECFSKLNELLSFVNDKHAHIRHMKSFIKSDSLVDDLAIEKYRESNIFKNHPTFDGELSTITTQLQSKPFESLEGIYKRDDKLTIGIYKKDIIYEGVVLASDLKTWTPGQIMLTIIPNGKDMYDVATSNMPGGKLYYIRALLHYNGTLWNLVKENSSQAGELKENQSDWEFKQLTEDTQYVYMGTFSNKSEKVEAFNTFYEETKDKFTAKNIIVDLRNNNGGNNKYSDPFYKIFKKNKMNVYVITNFWTGSNGEQFTLKLRKLKNTKHLGQRTYGALAYGSNYGNLFETPSGNFAIYPTDMNFHKFIEHEYVGVQPEIKLEFDSDWIDQTLDIIENDRH